MDTHRIHAYAEMFDKMHGILEQARSESAWWPPARCRGILADLGTAIFKVNHRLEAEQIPYTVWDVNFGALINSFWQSLHRRSRDDGVLALNVQVWRARFFVEALTPLLHATQTMEHLSDVMDQLEGSAEADDPNPCRFDG